MYIRYEGYQFGMDWREDIVLPENKGRVVYEEHRRAVLQVYLYVYSIQGRSRGNAILEFGRSYEGDEGL